MTEMILMLIKAFFIGGLLCAIGQVLILKTQLTSARILVGYVTGGRDSGRTGGSTSRSLSLQAPAQPFH